MVAADRAVHAIVASIFYKKTKVHRRQIQAQGQALTDRLKAMSRSAHRGGQHANLGGQGAADHGRRARGSDKSRMRRELAEVARMPALSVEGWAEGDAEDARRGGRRASGGGRGAGTWRASEEDDDASDALFLEKKARKRMLKSRGRHPRAAGAQGEDADAARTLEEEGRSKESAVDADIELPRSEAASNPPASSAPPSPLPFDESLKQLLSQTALGGDAAGPSKHRARATASSADAASPYDPVAAAAYSAVRFPGCLAAASHCLRAVAMRRGPGWAPHAVLDFGAGPGTAFWAAQRQWPTEPLRVTAVEPSRAMAEVGRSIQRELQRTLEREQEGAGIAPEEGASGKGWLPPFRSPGLREREGTGADSTLSSSAEEEEKRAASAPAFRALHGRMSSASAPVPAPVVRWLPRLPAPHQCESDLVVAAYVLGELSDDAARARLVGDLWRRTKDVLVLVEPGTPAGFRAVAAARAQILGLEETAGARRLKGRGMGSYGEAHVLAPCPHDGECPLLGRKSWCHFSQRFERSFLQRRAKAKGNLATVRGYQDERFSYVAIARGSRPEPLHAGVIVSPPSSSDDEAAEGEDYEDEESLDADEDDELMARLAQPEVFATLDPEAQTALRAYLDRTEASDEENARGGDLGVEDGSTPERTFQEDADDEAAEGDWDEEALASFPPEEELPLHAAQNWSRLLRPPVRRTRHVILDLCSADPSAPDGSRGRLWRQIVSRRKTLSVLDDKTAYRMARKLRWGDLWPAYYEEALKGFEPGVRRTEKALAELEEEEYDWRLGDPDAEDDELQFAFGGYERRGQDVEDEDEESKA